MDKKILSDYFAGRLSSEKEDTVRRFLLEHAEDENVSSMLEEIYESSSNEMDETALEGMYSTISRRLHLNPSAEKSSSALSDGKVWKKVYFAVAAAAVAAFLSLPLAFKAGERQVEKERDAVSWIEKTVPVGTVDSLLLADGSMIYLEGGTHIIYPSAFYGNERKVFVSGEIFAEVAKDPSRPFIVNAGEISVRVLGTTFNLKAYDAISCIEAVLLEGSINLELTTPSGEQTARMKPGSIAQYDRKTGQLTMSEFDRSAFSALKKGRGLYYNNISMQDIATDLSRVFGKKIVVADEKLAQTRYFAIFTNNESLDNILSAINSDGRMDISERDDTIYLNSK